jgi:hypothetical protein
MSAVAVVAARAGCQVADEGLPVAVAAEPDGMAVVDLAPDNLAGAMVGAAGAAEVLRFY